MCLDRANWKFRKNKSVNYLVLSWRINKKISLPLLFVELDKEGNSNTGERLDLLKDFDAVLGFGRINSLLADREFVGDKWFKALNKDRIPFFICIKQNTLLSWGDEPSQAVEFFSHLMDRQTCLVEVEKEMYGGTFFFAGTRAQSGDLVIVMSNQPLNALQILAGDLKIWSIEELFRKLETSGFHWGNTHMKISAWLVTLLVILGFALLMACVVGYAQEIPWKKTLGYPLSCVFKQGLITLQFLMSKSLTLAIQTLQTAFESLKNDLL